PAGAVPLTDGRGVGGADSRREPPAPALEGAGRGVDGCAGRRSRRRAPRGGAGGAGGGARRTGRGDRGAARFRRAAAGRAAGAIADGKRLAAQVDQEKKSAGDWEKRAVLAVQEGRDDLAKQALMRHNEHAQAAVQLHETWVKHREETEKLKLSLRQLNDRIE